MASRKARTTAVPVKLTWRNFSDAAHRNFHRLPCAPSLRPGLKTMIDAAQGSSVARAIVAAWNPSLFLAQFIRVEELAS